MLRVTSLLCEYPRTMVSYPTLSRPLGSKVNPFTLSSSFRISQAA